MVELPGWVGTVQKPCRMDKLSDNCQFFTFSTNISITTMSRNIKLTVNRQLSDNRQAFSKCPLLGYLIDKNSRHKKGTVFCQMTGLLEMGE